MCVCVCLRVCVWVLCECSGGHFSAVNGYTFTGHGHYHGYSRASWPHIITIVWIASLLPDCGGCCRCPAPPAGSTLLLYLVKL